MSKLLNKIISHIDINHTTYTHHQKQHYVGKYQDVYVEGVNIKVKLTEETFNHIYKKKFMGDPNVVELHDCYKWIEENIPGNITKEDLDD